MADPHGMELARAAMRLNSDTAMGQAMKNAQAARRKRKGRKRPRSARGFCWGDVEGCKGRCWWCLLAGGVANG